MYSIKNTDDLENWEELVSLQNQVEVRLQEKLSKQNFHGNSKKKFETVTGTKKNTSENQTKTLTESSIKNNQALENIYNKLLEILNDRCILATYLMSPQSKNTNPENSTQFKMVKDSSSNRNNDLF